MHRILLAVILTFSFSAAGFALTMEQAVDSALKNNFEVLASLHKQESAKYTAKAAQTPYYPQLDAKYQYLDSSEKAYGPEDKLSTFSLTLGYNLFNGFSNLFDQKAAKSAYIAEKYDTAAVRQDIILSVRKAYINVLSAVDGIRVADNAVELLENQLKDIKLSYDVGYVAKNEVLKVEAELASSRQGVLSAESAKKMAVFNLEKLTGLTIAADENFDNLPDYAGNLPETDTLKSEMMKDRSEIKYLEELIKAKQYSINSEKGGYLPSVDLGATYYSYGDDMSPSDRTYTYDSEKVLSLTVNMNIFDGLNKYNTTKSLQADKLYMIYTLRNTKENMTLQLKNAVENFHLAKASLAAAEKELASAQENYRITQSQFKQKVATNTDLMDARVMLTRAENTYSTARFNIQRAVADIERITEKNL